MGLSLLLTGKGISWKDELGMEQKSRDKVGLSKLVYICPSLYLTLTNLLVFHFCLPNIIQPTQMQNHREERILENTAPNFIWEDWRQVANTLTCTEHIINNILFSFIFQRISSNILYALIYDLVFSLNIRNLKSSMFMSAARVAFFSFICI